MRYECCPNDPKRFATALRRDAHTRNLFWDSSQGQDVILVQTPFGTDGSSMLEQICEALNKNQKPLNEFVEILNGVWVRYVSAAEKARNKGCRLNGEACTYTVFCAQQEGEVCRLYQPKNQAMITQSCSIPQEIRVTIQKLTRSEGFFRHREVDTGFYEMTFPSGLAAGYMDGSLCYRIKDFEIPVTKAMLETGTVYIKSAARPELVPKNKGLKII